MKWFIVTVALLLHFQSDLKAQSPNTSSFLSDVDFTYLKSLTSAVLDSSRIHPKQYISKEFGKNNTGGILIRPGGRNSYPSFWIRDYAMSLESDLVSLEEQEHLLMLTASTQCNQTKITKGGSMIPYGAIADHIRIDNSLPIYFPGTYSYENQGTETWGKTPPYSDQFLFIHMAWYYIKTTSLKETLLQTVHGMTLIDRLELAFKVPPAGNNQLVYTTTDFRGVDFGFRDAQQITGYLCYPSILKYRAANELSYLFSILNLPEKVLFYKNIAQQIKTAIPLTFLASNGMLKASTEKSQQNDVWSTALAVYLNAIDLNTKKECSTALAEAYKKGTLSYRGNIRHILTSDDFNKTTAWEHSVSKLNTYQNGSYWGTPVGWVCFAIAQTNLGIAKKLAKEYIDDLRSTDFRKGGTNGGPYECFHPTTGNLQNPVYLTTVSNPYGVFKKYQND